MFVDLMTQRTTRRPFSIDSNMEVMEFRNLQMVERQKIINLMSNENVSRYLPLMTGTFSSKSCDRFLQEKAKLWEKHGYGPWAIFIHDEFAGWGGLQLENDEVEFALVLHPEYWGWGKRIFDKTLAWAFSNTDIESITICLPVSRPNSNGILRLGFSEESLVSIEGQKFRKYRFNKTDLPPNH